VIKMTDKQETIRTLQEILAEAAHNESVRSLDSANLPSQARDFVDLLRRLFYSTPFGVYSARTYEQICQSKNSTNALNNDIREDDEKNRRLLVATSIYIAEHSIAPKSNRHIEEVGTITQIQQSTMAFINLYEGKLISTFTQLREDIVGADSRVHPFLVLQSRYLRESLDLCAKNLKHGGYKINHEDILRDGLPCRGGYLEYREFLIPNVGPIVWGKRFFPRE
jgi:hypothetical protein